MIHGGAQQVEMVDSIIAKEISPDPDASHTLVVKDLEDISSLYVQVKPSVKEKIGRHILFFASATH